MSQRIERPDTNLVSRENIKVSDACRVFGSRDHYHLNNICVLILPKRRSFTKMRMIIPEGTQCIITESARTLGIFKPGLYYRSGFYQVSHVVTTQYIPYHFNVKEDVQTKDNIRINIYVDLLFHITNAALIGAKMGLDNIENLMRTTQAEAVRSLVRQTYVSHAYDLRGQDSESMLESLNDKLNPFGFSVDQVSIASVSLPDDVASSLQEATIIQAKKIKQLKVQELTIRSQKAIQYIERIKLDKNNELRKFKEQMQKECDKIVNDLKEIQAKKEKELQKLQDQFNDKKEQLLSSNAFDVGKIEAQRDLEVNEIRSNAQIEAQKILAEGSLYVAKVKADVGFKVAQNTTKITQMRGEAERISQATLQCQRDFDYNMKQIDLMVSLAGNQSTVITGECENNDIAKLLVTSKTREAMGIKGKNI